MGKMYFNILATFAEFKVDLLRMRTREGMAVAKARGKLRGKQPKLSAKQQRELVRMYGTGEYTIADLAEVFTVSRTTVYRTLHRDHLSQGSMTTDRAHACRRRTPHRRITCPTLPLRTASGVQGRRRASAWLGRPRAFLRTIC